MYSRLLKNVVLPIADKAMGTSVSAYLKQIRQMRKYSREEIEEWQSQKLQDLIYHAYTRTRYYKRLFDKHGINPPDIRSISDLSRIPVLTKKDIRENFQDLIPDNIESIPYKKASTGGSTGDPLKYYLDLRSWSFSNANTIVNWERAGYTYGEKYIALGSTSLFVEKKKSIKHYLYYKLKNKIGLNGINMSDEVCRDYIDLIKRKKVKYIYGYASAIYILAKYVLKNKVVLNITTCFTTSEILSSHYRGTISEAFNCNIVDFYGAHDGGMTAFSHDENFFEVNYNSIVNLRESNNREGSSALLTDLFNYATPMINYQLGDEVLIDEGINEDYPYNGQIINKVIGRISDIIELENGSVLTGPGFTILFKDLPVEYYFIEKIGANSIKCHIKKLPDYGDKHEEIIFSTFKNQMKSNSKIFLNYTDKIYRSASGKEMYFKSD